MFCGRCGTSNPDDHAFCMTCGRALSSAGTPPRAAAPSSLDEAATLTDTLPRGTRLGPRGRWRIERTLGVGGMGRVYLATDTALDDRPVALKVLLDILAADGRAVRRLKTEATLAMDLAHPHIVRVNHFEDDEVVKFLVMEYVDGGSAAARLGREERLAEDEVRRLAVALCEALSHAHARNVLHRDLKPGNVLLTASGVPKLADFGIARLARDSLLRVTGQDDSVGTRPYMAPELLLGEPATVQSDLYALGATLYELLLGDPPFHTGDLTEQIKHRRPSPVAGVSEALNAVVLALLEKAPAKRPASADEVRALLGDGPAHRPVTPDRPWASSPAPAVGPAAPAAPQPARPAAAPKPESPRAPAPRPGETRPDERIPGVTWAYIPAGTFEMGATAGDTKAYADEEPRHTATLSRPFWLMTTPVTVGMMQALGLPLPAQPEWSADDHPVVNVTWDLAMAICGALRGRLPTEAEWEYAARGGLPGARYPWGDEAPVETPGARHGARFESDSTIAVGCYGANGFGLYDMAGNVWEWVADWYGAYASGAQTDPRGVASGSSRVVRGGSWSSYPRSLRVSYRFDFAPSYRDSVVGVRCARDVFP